MSDVVKRGGVTKAVEHGSIPDTPTETVDQYLRELKNHQHEWAQYPLKGILKLLTEAHANVLKYLDDWAQADIKGRHIPEGHPEVMVSYRSAALVGTATRNYIYTLKQLIAHKGKTPYVKARQVGPRVVIDSYPRKYLDKLLLKNTRAEIWLKPGTTIDKLTDYQASSLRDESNQGGLAFIMSAGNVSAATFADLYQKLIMERQVCIIKTHPVQEYMKPILEKVLAPFITAGFVRIIAGGAPLGRYIIQHPLVQEIAFTGSDKTFDAMVYGIGEEGIKNKTRDKRILDKDVACELGNVTPVIVVPGNWTEQELDYQAKNIFSMLANNNAYACVAARTLILPKKWDLSERLIQKLKQLFETSVKPINYYPGTEQTLQEALENYPDAMKFGELTSDTQPFVFATDLNPKKDEIAFTREFWAAFMAQVYIEGKNTADYLHNAVQFANDKLWGTLGAVIIIDPATEKELTEKNVLQACIDQLKYGTIVLNAYAGLSLSLGTNPWGGYPNSSYQDIQSGNTYTLNPFMLDHIEKSVIYTPFCKLPLPMWKPGIKSSPELARAAAKYAITGRLIDFVHLLRSRKKYLKSLSKR